MAFRIPGIHYPAPIQAISLQMNNTLFAAELQKIAMLVIQSQSMVAATSIVAPTVTPFTFNGSEFFRCWDGVASSLLKRY